MFSKFTFSLIVALLRFIVFLEVLGLPVPAVVQWCQSQRLQEKFILLRYATMKSL